MEDGEKIIPDITWKNRNKNIFIEFESLVGTIEPLKKIDHSVEKYKRYIESTSRKSVIRKNDEVWIVLRPISALIHMEELKKRMMKYEKIYENLFKVNIFVLMHEKGEWKLKNLDAFDKNFTEITPREVLNETKRM
jgi:gamma-glutamyl:cysteine ligase YbdK (ATP-grasp superfamily)